MGITAGFLVQNALKFLLEFGQVSTYLGYAALTDHFPTMTLKPNPECTSFWCRKQQAAWNAGEADRQKAAAAAAAEAAAAAAAADPVQLHESNDWGIELDSGDDGGEAGEAGDGDESGGAEAPALAAGIEYAHVSSAQAHTAIDAQDDGEDLADLMAQLKSVQ